uniref:IrrE N-terminal-like domain-containing protein n=1 Tax=Candidatus Kentrum sp. LFY TaxID=2126342 RepID=A0A450W8T1_9GAMM|nr:MAG: protein of unknown function (DUF955) [Candidatus Kentron sp. LFY]
MDEFPVIQKARQFINDAAINSVPVDVERLASNAKAKINVRTDMDDDESGQTFSLGGKNFITVNGNQREERQRFTILHEIAHIVLELPSHHHGDNITTSDLVSYRRRPKEEMLCDVFAAECLLPYKFFSRDVGNIDVSLHAVKELAKKYKASITSTGSRFAVYCNAPCAFVLIENDKIRYVSSSKFLRELNGWIEIGISIPQGSVAYRLIKEPLKMEDYDEVESNIWFNNGIKGYELVAEEAMLIREWNQCLSLIWLDESLRRVSQTKNYDDQDEGALLKELNGVLPWPSKRRRK